MPRTVLRLAAWGVAATVVAAGLAVAGVKSGIYDVSAMKPHGRAVYWVLDAAREASIQRHSRDVPVPDGYPAADAAETGRVLYEANCRVCHGAPGVAPDAIALAMNPAPPALAQMAKTLKPREIYWSISNGIKMTGMPAWSHRLTEAERWSVTAFVQASLSMAPGNYRDRKPPAGGPAIASAPEVPRWFEEGARERGQVALTQYACPTCHAIPGITGSDVRIAPPLTRIGARMVLAGMLPNTTETMVAWLRDPPALKPGTAMPNLGVSEADARDIAAYLATVW